MVKKSSELLSSGQRHVLCDTINRRRELIHSFPELKRIGKYQV